MVANSYNIVNFCRLCKKRYVSKKGDPRKYYCDACQKKINSYKKEEEKENKK